MLRYATVKDAIDIAELEKQVFPDTCLNEHSCKREIANGRCWIADGQGYALTRWGTELIDILRLGVLPEQQGKGVGTYLLRNIILRADLPVILTVRKDNARAISLYRKHGFKPVAQHIDPESYIFRLDRE